MLALAGLGAPAQTQPSPEQHEWKDLLKAAEKGDLQKIQQLLDRGIDVNVQDDDGRTALYVAAKNGRSQSVSALLEAGADTIDQLPLLKLGLREDLEAELRQALKKGQAERLQTLMAAGVYGCPFSPTPTPEGEAILYLLKGSYGKQPLYSVIVDDKLEVSLNKDGFYRMRVKPGRHTLRMWQKGHGLVTGFVGGPFGRKAEEFDAKQGEAYYFELATGLSASFNELSEREALDQLESKVERAPFSRYYATFVDGSSLVADPVFIEVNRMRPIPIAELFGLESASKLRIDRDVLDEARRDAVKIDLDSDGSILYLDYYYVDFYVVVNRKGPDGPIDFSVIQNGLKPYCQTSGLLDRLGLGRLTGVDPLAKER